jgi:hypothetical protein
MHTELPVAAARALVGICPPAAGAHHGGWRVGLCHTRHTCDSRLSAGLCVIVYVCWHSV